MTEAPPQTAPERLFKYRSLSGASRAFTLALLGRGDLYFAAPTEFNDPFDTIPRISLEATRAEKDAYFRNLIDKKASELPRPDRRRFLGRMRRMPEADRVRIFEEGALNTARQMAVCSFSAKGDDILMWAHYAANHSGICLAFDTAALASSGFDLSPAHYGNQGPS